MSYESEVLADSPALYWRLGEPSGTTAADASGNGRTGEYKNTPTLGVVGALSGSGDSNTAVGFEAASNERCDSSYNPFSAGTSFAVECWAYAIQNATNNRLLGTSTNPGGWNIVVNNGAGTRGVSFDPNTNVAGAAEWANAFPGNEQWVHVVLNFNNAGNSAELFINGESKGSKTAENDFSAGPGNFQVGTAGAVPWNGRIDEVSLYLSLLSAERVSAHYLAGTTEAATARRLMLLGIGQ